MGCGRSHPSDLKQERGFADGPTGELRMKNKLNIYSTLYVQSMGDFLTNSILLKRIPLVCDDSVADAMRRRRRRNEKGDMSLAQFSLSLHVQD